MARFAFWKRKASEPDTLNLAGGQAHTMSSKLEFASALLTTFTTDTFYASAGDQVTRIAELTRKLEDPLFAAKAAIYTRKQNGLRSVSHIVAGEPEHVNDFETKGGLSSGSDPTAAESRRDHGNRFAFPTAPWKTLRVSHTSKQRGLIIMQFPLFLKLQVG